LPSAGAAARAPPSWQAAVASNHVVIDGNGLGPGRDLKAGFSGVSLAMAAACRAQRRRAAGVRTLVVATPMRFPMTAARMTSPFSSATFWWMVLLAKRVRLLAPPR
jgi:hypothetical protein